MKKLIMMTMVLAAVQSGTFAMATPKEAKPVESKASTATKNIKPKVPQVKLQAPSGDRYEATVPDTLDLAYRSEMALRGIARTVDPENDYLVWSEIFWANDPAYMKHNFYDLDLTPKAWEAMGQLRLACGSEEFLDIEQGMQKTLFSYLDKDDGLYYY
ncbi:MAG: hypothetical protein DRP56_10765, partial [Planctomycetota bacterium]